MTDWSLRPVPLTDYTEIVDWMDAAEKYIYKLEDQQQQLTGTRDTIEALQARVAELEDELFKIGRMEESPCFCCGYNGANYFQPNIHKCAARHHALRIRT